MGYDIPFAKYVKILLLNKSNKNKRGIKKGKLLISHRYNHLPLLHSWPGGVQRELVV